MHKAREFLGLAILAGAVASAPAQEGGSHEALVKQSLVLLNGINTALATVKDRETAEKSRPELRKLAAAWQEMRKKAAELPPPDRAEKDRLAKEYKTELRKEEGKLRGEILRLDSILGGAAALQEITGILKKTEQ